MKNNPLGGSLLGFLFIWLNVQRCKNIIAQRAAAADPAQVGLRCVEIAAVEWT